VPAIPKKPPVLNDWLWQRDTQPPHYQADLITQDLSRHHLAGCALCHPQYSGENWDAIIS
jgi:hypothetical protein